MTNTATRIIIPLLAAAALLGGAEAAAADTPVEPKRKTFPLPPKGSVTMLDFDHDGRFEHIRFDLDGDGRRDAIVQDNNGDGRWDYHWVDDDRDGEIDDNERRRLNKAARRRRCNRSGRLRYCARHGKLHRVIGVRRRALRRLRVPVAQQPQQQAPAPQQQAPAPQQQAPAPQQPAPATSPEPAPGLPPTAKPTGLTVDTDGDGAPDTVHGDDTLPAGSSYPAPSGDVVVGTKDGGKPLGGHGVDNDRGDGEVVTTDPTLPPELSYGRDLDNDGDVDLVVIGTKDAEVAGAQNVDGDANDEEIVVYDSTLPSGMSSGIDVDGDGDDDVCVIGTK
jgi:hypothetical protein